MKLRGYLAAASEWLGLPTDIAAGLPHMEVSGFRECAIDRHTGILEYNTERVVVALKSGRVVISGSQLVLRLMHRERLCVTGRIAQLTFLEGDGADCGRSCGFCSD